MNPPSSSIAPRSGILDAWRALACLSVAWWHGVGNLLHADVHPLMVPVVAIGSHGWLGVPIFFVISGYCIAATVEKDAARTGGAIRFWRDRLFRIYPVYWVAWLLAMALAWAATPLNGLPAASAFPASTQDVLANTFLVTDWLGRPADLNVAWSLNYEIGFYVLMGGLLLLPNSGPGLRLAILSGLTAVALTPLASCLPVLAMWPQFACGIAAHATLNRALPRSARGAASGFLGLFALHAIATGNQADMTTAFTAFGLAFSLAGEPRLPRPPRWLVHIGIASFSIYLMHLPLMRPALNLLHRRIAPTEPLYLPFWSLHVLFGVTGGLLLHHFVEQRWERVRARLKSQGRPSTAP